MLENQVLGPPFCQQEENPRVKWLFLLQARFLETPLIKSLIPAILIVQAGEIKSDEDPHHILSLETKILAANPKSKQTI